MFISLTLAWIQRNVSIGRRISSCKVWLSLGPETAFQAAAEGDKKIVLHGKKSFRPGKSCTGLKPLCSLIDHIVLDCLLAWKLNSFWNIFSSKPLLYLVFIFEWYVFYLSKLNYAVWFLSDYLHNQLRYLVAEVRKRIRSRLQCPSLGMWPRMLVNKWQVLNQQFDSHRHFPWYYVNFPLIITR